MSDYTRQEGYRVKSKVKLSLNAIAIVALLMLSMASNPLAAQNTAPLLPTDFKASSFAKVIDLVDFARARAFEKGLTPPPADVHAYVYTVWINTSGIQVFYTGMVNMTKGGPYFTIPMQSFLEHFKSQQGKDVLVASSFLSLLSFKEGSNTIYRNSPDRNDTVYASFSLGTSIPALTNQPRQNNSATVTPLASSPDGLQWSWGMTYHDLTAFWWKLTPDPTNATWDGIHPLAITTYSELTFKYSLVLDPASKTATIRSSFVIGEMTNLWLIDWSHLFPTAIHYNNSGNYYMNGTQRGSETIHQIVSAQNFKLSIVLFQSSFVVSHKEHSDDPAGTATDTEHDVSSGSITTSADDNEKLFETNFGTKATYQLVNSTSGQTSTYSANTRTTRIYGYAGNHAFDIQTFFIHIEAFVILAFHPTLFAHRDDLDIARANFVYVISYPTWGGYKVIHDPTYTAYYSPAQAPALSPAFLAAIGIVVVGILGGAVLFSRRRHVNLPVSPTGN